MNDQQSTENFWLAWNSLATEVNTIKEPEYRLYYDDQGYPLFYSMQECVGNYVVVSKETYKKPPKHVRVVDGQLRVYETSSVKKLIPSTQGTSCDPQDVCVVVPEKQDHVKWSLKQTENSKYYDI